MPTLAAALDFAKLEGRNFRAHQLAAAPGSPVTGQLYYDTGSNSLFYWNGSTWVAASGGTPADATTSTKGIVQLAGDLAGTAASPQIAAGVIVDADVAAANKDGAVGVASMRTLGAGAQQAMPGNRTLDAISAPIASVNFNNQRGISAADPTGPQDVATKAYVDAVAVGLDAKGSVKAATTANITLSGTQTVDGVALVANDRCLVKNQTTASGNGIYSVQAGAWTRVTDMDAWAEVPGAFVFVEQGTTLADTGWVSTADAGGTLGSTNITWTQFSSAGSYIGGAGLLLTGTTFDVGAGAGITVNADSVQVANNGITNAMIADGAINLASADVTGTLPLGNGGTGQTTAAAARTALGTPGYYSSATHGAGTSISITAATHGLGAKRGLIVQLQLEADGSVVLADVLVAASGDITVNFGASQTANSIRVTVVG
jgi:Repeat of unknown function (DUF5907)